MLLIQNRAFQNLGISSTSAFIPHKVIKVIFEQTSFYIHRHYTYVQRVSKHFPYKTKIIWGWPFILLSFYYLPVSILDGGEYFSHAHRASKNVVVNNRFTNASTLLYLLPMAQVPELMFSTLKYYGYLHFQTRLHPVLPELSLHFLWVYFFTF